MPSLEALSVWGPGQREAARAAAVALRDAGVVLQVSDALVRGVCLLLRHVLEVYLKHNQQISKVLCVVGSDAKSRVLLVLGWAMKTAGVELQLVATDPALCKTLGAQPALPRRLRDVQLVLAGDVAPEILEKVRTLTEKATVHPGPGFPRALATAQSWDAMGKPKDTTLTTSEHFEQVVPAKLEACCGFVLGKAFEHNDAARLGSADAPTAPLPASTSLTGGDVRRHRTTIYDCMP